MNIVNGKVAPENVNTHKALEIGIAQMREIQEILTKGFHDVIERRVKFMQQMKKVFKHQGKELYVMETLFANILLIGP